METQGNIVCRICSVSVSRDSGELELSPDELVVKKGWAKLSLIYADMSTEDGYLCKDCSAAIKGDIFARAYRCLRCGHVSTRMKKHCGHCKSPYWMIPRGILPHGPAKKAKVPGVP